MGRWPADAIHPVANRRGPGTDRNDVPDQRAARAKTIAKRRPSKSFLTPRERSDGERLRMASSANR